MALKVLVQGGGDLASGVILRLHRAGWDVVVTELPQPLAVRRLVSFAQAVFTQQVIIENVKGCLVDNIEDIFECWENKNIPVLVDPSARVFKQISPDVIIDARMLKRPPELAMDSAKLVIGIGPGFQAGKNCHAVIESKRGPLMGRVYWNGEAEPDTGLPEAVANHQSDRVLRSPASGVFNTLVEIGEEVKAGQAIAHVDNQFLLAPFNGILRGLLHSGLQVTKNMKVGDLDPRMDKSLVTLVSDKALAIGGGVLEIILSRQDLRGILWSS